MAVAEAFKAGRVMIGQLGHYEWCSSYMRHNQELKVNDMSRFPLKESGGQNIRKHINQRRQ